MHAETDSLPDAVVKLREEMQRLQQELAAVKRLLGLGSQSVVDQKRLGSLQVQGISIYPHGGDHPDHADLQLSVADEGGMIKFRNGPKYPLMTLFCDEVGGHVEIHGREGGDMVKLRVKDGSGQVAVMASGHNGIAGMKVQANGGVVVVQGREAEVLGLMHCTPAGGEVYAFGKGNKSRVALWHDDFGGVMTVDGKQSEMKAHVRTMIDGGVFVASNAQGKSTFIASGGDPMGRIVLMNAQENCPLRIGGDDDGAWLHVSDHDGEGGVRLSLVNRCGRVEVFGTEHVQADLRIDKDGGSLSLSNTAGESLVTAGACPYGGHVLVQGMDRNQGGLFGVGEHGATVELSGRDHLAHVNLHTTEHGGMIRVMGNDGMCRAAMNVTGEGGQFVVFNDDSKIQATMHTRPDGGVVTAYGFNGQPRASLAAAEEGGRVVVFDNKNRSKAGMVATKDGGQIGLTEGDANRILIAFDPERNFIGIFNNDEDPCVLLVASPNGGLIEVFGTDGGVKASLPM
jgi:hypothetical protein